MNLKEYKIERLQEFKALLNKENEELLNLCNLAEIKNRWFSQENIWNSISALKTEFLDSVKLNTWLESYPLQAIDKSLGVITAGNIPLVGFQDILAAFVVNAATKIKVSSKDEVLMTYFINKLKEIDITWKVEIVDRLVDYDAVIATGSNNTNRYFEQYFRKVPNILRKNRNSIAILNGTETPEQLDLLAGDIFEYFGLGCRSVSKLFLPNDYDLSKLFKHFDNFEHLKNHSLYKDNYDYNRTLLLMNLDEHLANDFVMMKEDESLNSRLATINYSYYNNEEEIQDYIINHNQEIQVVVSQKSDLWQSEGFGKAQKPGLSDYADNVDVMDFLLGLG